MMANQVPAADGLHDRLAIAVGDRTYRKIGQLTGTHPETVRRYMQGQSPSIEFVTNLCRTLDIEPKWLLLGEGPMFLADALASMLRTASPSELLDAISSTLERLESRMDGLELSVEQAEAHANFNKKSALTIDSEVTDIESPRRVLASKLVETRSKGQLSGNKMAG